MTWHLKLFMCFGLLGGLTGWSQTRVTINEFMASNQTSVTDQNGEYDDWIELYNPTNAEINLSGYFLSDNPENLTKYALPSGTTMNAKGFLIIWADENGKQAGLHANFKLSASGESLMLLTPDSVLLERVDFGAQQTDLSYARIPDGIGAFQITTHTFNKSNSATLSTKAVSLNTLGIHYYPNPTQGEIRISADEANSKSGRVFDLLGRPRLQFQLEQELILDLGGLEPGLYILYIEGATGLVMLKS